VCTILVSYGANSKLKRAKESDPEKLKKVKLVFPNSTFIENIWNCLS